MEKRLPSSRQDSPSSLKILGSHISKELPRQSLVSRARCLRERAEEPPCIKHSTLLANVPRGDFLKSRDWSLSGEEQEHIDSQQSIFSCRAAGGSGSENNIYVISITDFWLLHLMWIRLRSPGQQFSTLISRDMFCRNTVSEEHICNARLLSIPLCQENSSLASLLFTLIYSTNNLWLLTVC